MLDYYFDYSDISNKIDEAKDALAFLYDLVYHEYDGVFEGKDAEEYQRMLQGIRNADKCLDEINEINDRLYDAFVRL